MFLAREPCVLYACYCINGELKAHAQSSYRCDTHEQSCQPSMLHAALHAKGVAYAIAIVNGVHSKPHCFLTSEQR